MDPKAVPDKPLRLRILINNAETTSLSPSLLDIFPRMAPRMPMQTPEVEMNWYQRSVSWEQGLPSPPPLDPSRGERASKSKQAMDPWTWRGIRVRVSRSGTGLAGLAVWRAGRRTLYFIILRSFSSPRLTLFEATSLSLIRQAPLILSLANNHLGQSFPSIISNK